MKNSKARDFIHKFSIYIILVAMFIICAIVNDNFLSARNLINVARQLSVGTILAYGEMLLVIAGLIDLSVGSVLALAGVLSIAAYQSTGSLLVGFLVAIAVGVACGFINFTIYRVSKIPPWIAGLGMTMAYEAIVGIYSQARANKGLQVEFLRDENRILGSQPWIFIVLIICVVISYIIYNHTTIGINIRAAGCNENVAKTMGINQRH